jgi:hypothetical protein
MRQWGRKAWWNSLSSGEVMVEARTIGEFEEATEKLRGCRGDACEKGRRGNETH